MAKTKSTIFFCQNCGNESSKWMGQCPICKEWNTFTEEMVVSKSSGAAVSKGMKSVRIETKPKTLSEISALTEMRTSTGMKELDRVLGVVL